MHISKNMLLRGVANSFIVFALLFSSGAHSIGLGQRGVVTAKKWTPPTAELYNQVCDFIANELTPLEAFLERRVPPHPDERIGGSATVGYVYRYAEHGIRLDYLIWADGRKQISQVWMSADYLARRKISNNRVSKLFGFKIPRTFVTGCDHYEMEIRKSANRIDSLLITVDLD